MLVAAFLVSVPTLALSDHLGARRPFSVSPFSLMVTHSVNPLPETEGIRGQRLKKNYKENKSGTQNIRKCKAVVDCSP